MTCPFCRDAGTCARCRRLADVRTVVEALDRLVDGAIAADAVGALGRLMVERGALVAAHRRELNDEAREAQRGARAAYDEGRWVGRREE